MAQLSNGLLQCCIMSVGLMQSVLVGYPHVLKMGAGEWPRL